jgi:hypothetical protein
MNVTVNVLINLGLDTGEEILTRGFCRSIKVVFFHQSFLGQLEAQRNQAV